MANSPELPDGTVEVRLRHQDRDRSYFLHTGGAEQAIPKPLLLALHGRGIAPLMFDRWTGYSALADEEGFVLAMPSAIGEIWNDGRYRGPSWRELEAIDDVGYLHVVIDDVIGRQAVDPERIYLAGMSNGAAMGGCVAWERPGRIGAFAQVAGTAAVAIVERSVPEVPVRILQMHGTHDRWAPYAGGRARGILARLIVRHPAGSSLSVDDWARALVLRNGAGEEPDVETVAPGVTVRRWGEGSPSSDVVFYQVEGGGHTWPGARIWMPPHLGRTTPALDATRISWDFLSNHGRGT